MCNIIYVAVTVYAVSRSEAAAEESGLAFKRRGGVRMGKMRVGSRRMMGVLPHPIPALHFPRKTGPLLCDIQSGIMQHELQAVEFSAPPAVIEGGH